jgi:membrane associated rhomboid family serine protease
VENGVDEPLVGASGAIAGVMAAYLVLFQNARLTFMLILFQLKLPVWAWMAIWLGIQVLGYLYDPSGGLTHVSWIAHVSGFLAGLLLVWPFRARLVERHALLHLLQTRRL